MTSPESAPQELSEGARSVQFIEQISDPALGLLFYGGICLNSDPIAANYGKEPTGTSEKAYQDSKDWDEAYKTRDEFMTALGNDEVKTENISWVDYDIAEPTDPTDATAVRNARMLKGHTVLPDYKLTHVVDGEPGAFDSWFIASERAAQNRKILLKPEQVVATPRKATA
ncbi:MAG: hypothetical protein QFB87_00790 [Patescibacteria group bacterium]|nr:hypothetical protein [Patescibacteria group bacterium]